MLFKPKFLLAMKRPGKDNKVILVGTASKATVTQRTKKIKAKTNGNNTVQQTVISWSKRIRGNEALTQINVKIMIQVLNPNERPWIKPSRIILSVKETSIKGNG